MLNPRCRTGDRCAVSCVGTADSWARALRATACGILLLLAAASASAQEPAIAGRIKIASGSAFIVRANTDIPAQAGQAVYQADTLKTGNDGRLGITLKDDTRLSLGPNSEIRLDKFAFAPAEGRRSCSRSSAAWPATCRARSPRSRLMPCASKPLRPSSASGEPPS
jgi:hypothetical protein